MITLPKILLLGLFLSVSCAPAFATELLEAGPNDFRISFMPGTGDADYDAFSLAIAYNPIDHEYLVVWFGEDDLPGLINSELELYGQRQDADGQPIGNNDFRISEIKM